MMFFKKKGEKAADPTTTTDAAGKVTTGDNKTGDILKVEEAQNDTVVDRRYSAPAAFSEEERIRIEKKLKMKLDARFSILVLIYILNCQ